MMRQYELVERVARYKPDVNEALLNKAYVYAMQKHGHQKRASGDPYFSHPLEVAAILTDMHMDEATIAVALLHDTIEDTQTGVEELRTLFGTDVASLVMEVTDDKNLPKEERKRKQIESAPKKSKDAKLIKLADKTSNLRTIASSPAAGWSVKRRLEYIAWAKNVVAGLRGTSSWLEQQFDVAVIQAEQSINPPLAGV